MDALKILHIACAMLTGVSFFIRGIWMIRGSRWLSTRAVKIVPHVIDTLLLSSAVAMLVSYHLNPMAHGWLLAKIIALVLYISFGMLAFRFARQKCHKIAFWLLALLTLGVIYYLAINKHLPFL